MGGKLSHGIFISLHHRPPVLAWTRFSWRRCLSTCFCCLLRRRICLLMWRTTSLPQKLICCLSPSPLPQTHRRPLSSTTWYCTYALLQFCLPLYVVTLVRVDLTYPALFLSHIPYYNIIQLTKLIFTGCLLVSLIKC